MCREIAHKERQVEKALDTTASQEGGDPVQRGGRRDRTSGPTEPGICPVNGMRTSRQMQAAPTQLSNP